MDFNIKYISTKIVSALSLVIFACHSGGDLKKKYSEDNWQDLLSVSFDSKGQSLSEGNQGVAVRIVASSPLSKELRLKVKTSGTATRDQDYSLSSEEVILPAHSQSTSFSVTFNDDAEQEETETIEVSL